jgi:uncharacterized damage-inducible protein DinB
MWNSIMQLSDEQFVAEIDYSHGSIRNQVIHLTAVDGRWLRALLEAPSARQYSLEPVDYPTRSSAFAVWEETADALQGYVANLTERELQRIPRGLPGQVWQVLLHLVNHGTDHRAQILRALHDHGEPTFDQDWILDWWSH